MDEYVRDINEAAGRMGRGLRREELEGFLRLRDKLLELHNRNLVKINHSVMELLCAKYLIHRGFEVDLERTLNGVSCDLYAVKGLGTVIVEVETGFVPPEHALDPERYLKARIASKIVRYSGYANMFCLATPPHYVMQIPPALTKPPRFRTDEEVAAIKGLCDLYYTRPPVTVEEIKHARLHSVLALDVGALEVREWELSDYVGKAALWGL